MRIMQNFLCKVSTWSFWIFSPILNTGKTYVVRDVDNANILAADWIFIIVICIRISCLCVLWGINNCSAACVGKCSYKTMQCAKLLAKEKLCTVCWVLQCPGMIGAVCRSQTMVRWYSVTLEPWVNTGRGGAAASHQPQQCFNCLIWEPDSSTVQLKNCEGLKTAASSHWTRLLWRLPALEIRRFSPVWKLSWCSGSMPIR